MSKVKLLLDVIEDMRSLADSLQAVADSMKENEPQAEKPAKPKKIAAKDAAATKEEKPLTLEDVRAVLADKSRKGYTAEVKALLLKHGADKLSDIRPTEYQSLLADAEVL